MTKSSRCSFHIIYDDSTNIQYLLLKTEYTNCKSTTWVNCKSVR